MSSKRTDLTVDRRAWVIVTRVGRTPTWQCVDPGQTLSTTGDVATYQRREQAVQAMRGLLGDPAWEADEDPPEPPLEEKLREEIEVLKSAARVTLSEALSEERISNVSVETQREISAVFKEWAPFLTYARGEIRRHQGELYRCLQDYTAHDPNHTPDTVPALWAPVRSAPQPVDPSEPSTGSDPEVSYPVWEQPDSTNPYNSTWGDGSSPVVVRWPDENGNLYENTHGDGNVWPPETYGWTRYTPPE